MFKKHRHGLGSPETKPHLKTRRFFTAVAATLAGLAVLSGCTAQPSQAEDNTLTYLEPQFFRTLYPPSAGFYPNGSVVNNIADRLLYQDPETLELKPWIATELPEVNEDATEFTFNIRTDVTYSDGTPLTAENVVKNFDLYGLGDQDRRLTISEQITNYDHGEVVDEDTVRFYFSEPAPGFAQATSSFNAGLYADSTLEFANEDFAPGNAQNVIGSGPFVITDETLGTNLTLTAREDYDWAPPSREHQGRAKLDAVNYVLAGEESVRIGAIVAGQGDIARQIEAPVEAHLKDAGITIISAATNGVNNSFNFRFKNELLSDIRVRQALIHAIDREKIMRVLFSDSYPLATSVLAQNALGYKEQVDAYVYDLDKATALLDEAGWTLDSDGMRRKDGELLELTFNEALPQPRSREVVTMVQEQLGDLGIKVNLNPGDQAAQDADSKDLNKIQVRHTMVGRADYDVLKSQLYSTNRNELLNMTMEGETADIGDPHLEELLMAIASSPREEDRAAASAAAQDYITEQAYVLPLFEEPVVYGVQPYVKGFSPEVIGRPSFYETYIDHSSDHSSEED
ncbi:TIGR04028 family ABC transporter substrate-binding protein [Corynebacterium glutamicum]|uniref:TIGR04028 family ABC transporter substrate-binding protein n=1 Tax=Corynebacterium glutamicum TaxID=1718 RepID=UPI000744BC2A|nr:TIGR04028 family ABC transporter substrate-binding protein [Corynebacterium glutamicum]AMA00877.1 ABC transporter substrate-binding protein [Corynebacterium glutamicum]